MADLSYWVIIWLSAVVLVAAFVQGLTGFGLAVICTPMLSFVLPVRVSVPLAAVCGVLVTIPIVMTLRCHVRWGAVCLLVLSALPGVWLGAGLLAGIPPDWIIGAMGFILVGLSVFRLSRGRVPAWLNGRWLAVLSGFASGAVGAATAAPGPPLIAYLSLQDWDTREAKAVMNVYFLFQGLVAMPAYFYEGLMTGDVLRLLGWAIPMLIVGLTAGLVAAHQLHSKDEWVRRIVNIAMLLLGLVLLGKLAA
jgi:uncharacterized membrane protein YfcA